MIPKILFLFMAAFSDFSVADKTASQGPEKTEIHLFGGYRANRAQVDTWANSVRSQAQNQFKGLLIVKAYPYPSKANASSKSAVGESWELATSLSNEINKNTNTTYIVVGHSSGTAISNFIASRARREKGGFVSVNLDGFAPWNTQANANTVCVWGEISAKQSDRKKPLSSTSGKFLSGGCQNQKKVDESVFDGCENKWCLHFRILNVKSPSTLNNGNMIKNGYDSFQANPIWSTAASSILKK